MDYVVLIQKLQSLSAMLQLLSATDTPGFAHYVADNVDHNIQTIDGMNIFYGMEMIADTTPDNANDQMHSRQCS